MPASAPKLSFFMGGSLFSGMIVPAVCDTTRAQGTSHETLAGFMTGWIFQPGGRHFHPSSILPLQPTQSIPDVLDLPSQKGEARRS
jgi:hypothetical protein